MPVDIYKQWINSLESDSGKVCGLSYDVSAEEALKHQEVSIRFQRSIVLLKQFTTLFLATIVKAKSKNLLPYGLLHLSKVLHQSLRKKFPNAPNKEILKVVGNLLYYRFINCAIVAPDVFGIVDKSTLDGGNLNPDQVSSSCRALLTGNHLNYASLCFKLNNITIAHFVHLT